ncbi:FadR/GntR family transcriptional regulator [Nocardioides pyridinolyticus]
MRQDSKMTPRSEAGSSLASRVPKASDVLADMLRGEILAGGLAPGDPFLSEADIIERYEFSRGTVRESMRLLETEGLIVVKRGPSGGVRVSAPQISTVSRSLGIYLTTSEATLRDLFAFRKLVEPAAAAAAAEHATSEQRAALLSATEFGYDAHASRVDSSVSFHDLVADASGNHVLSAVLASMHHVLEWQSSAEQLSEVDMDATGRAHRRIAQAIAGGRVEDASAAMLTHLEEFESVVGQQNRLNSPIVPRSRWNRSR